VNNVNDFMLLFLWISCATATSVSGSLFFVSSCHLRFSPNFSILSNHFFRLESSEFFIGPTYVTLTGLTPQNSNVDFFNWFTLGRPNANQ